MNKKLLCAALLGSLGLAQAASAQEFDDRWYISGSTGVNFQDNDRHTEDSMYGTLGFGKFLTQKISLEAELNYQNPDKTHNPNLWWSQYGVSVDGRYHFRNADSKWWPYLRGGIGWQRNEEEYDASPNPVSISTRSPARRTSRFTSSIRAASSAGTSSATRPTTTSATGTSVRRRRKTTNDWSR